MSRNVTDCHDKGAILRQSYTARSGERVIATCLATWATPRYDCAMLTHTHALRLRDRTATARLLYGCDVREGLRTLPDASVHAACTSPPYFGLRDYGADGQIGLESTPEAFVSALVDVFREVKRVLRPDGTLWVNLGDSYNNAGSSKNGTGLDGRQRGGATGPAGECGYKKRDLRHTLATSGIKHKDLIGIPWRVAFALQADGWHLRQDIIWHKPNPMPESVTDRCTKAHEYVFLLAHPDSGGRYYYDAEAVKEASAQPERKRADRFGGNKYVEGVKHSDGSVFTGGETRNRRSVWTVTPKPYQGAHFATWPPDLVSPMILAGCPAGGTVLDPFSGSATTGAVALPLGRNYVGIDLNPDYLPLAIERLQGAKSDDDPNQGMLW